MGVPVLTPVLTIEARGIDSSQAGDLWVSRFFLLHLEESGICGCPDLHRNAAAHAASPRSPPDPHLRSCRFSRRSSYRCSRMRVTSPRTWATLAQACAGHEMRRWAGKRKKYSAPDCQASTSLADDRRRTHRAVRMHVMPCAVTPNDSAYRSIVFVNESLPMRPTLKTVVVHRSVRVLPQGMRWGLNEMLARHSGLTGQNHLAAERTLAFPQDQNCHSEPHAS